MQVREEIKAENPDKSFGEQTKIMATKWKELGEWTIDRSAVRGCSQRGLSARHGCTASTHRAPADCVVMIWVDPLELREQPSRLSETGAARCYPNAHAPHTA